MGDFCVTLFWLLFIAGVIHGVARLAKSRSDPEGYARDEEERRERRKAAFGLGMDVIGKWLRGK